MQVFKREMEEFCTLSSLGLLRFIIVSLAVHCCVPWNWIQLKFFLHRLIAVWPRTRSLTRQGSDSSSLKWECQRSSPSPRIIVRNRCLTYRELKSVHGAVNAQEMLAAILLLHGSECTKQSIRWFFFLSEKGRTSDDSFLKVIIDLQKCFCEILTLDSY